MSLQFLLSIRNCKTVVLVCSEHIVVDRVCVRRRLVVLVCSLWQELVQKHIRVLGPFLPSFRYINCIVTIANIVFIDYHFFPMLFVRFT